MKKFIAALVICFIPGLVFGEVVTDLNGFRLWQYMAVANSAYGEPDQVIKEQDSTYKVFYLSDKAYMVFEHLNDKEHNVFSIQITGKTTKMIPFKGLVLGDAVEKVKKNLGEPTSVRTQEGPKVDIYEYEDTNYSVEIDEDGKLYSIRINVNNELFGKALLSDDHWTLFTQAVLEKDNAKIFGWLRPDVEIYKDGKIISIDKKMSEFNENPTTEFIQSLIADKNSVYAALKESEPDGEMRLSENMGVGSVFKFYKGNILTEIVFFPYKGKYRVYEIAFKSAK